MLSSIVYDKGLSVDERDVKFPSISASLGPSSSSLSFSLSELKKSSSPSSTVFLSSFLKCISASLSVSLSLAEVSTVSSDSCFLILSSSLVVL